MRYWRGRWWTAAAAAPDHLAAPVPRWAVDNACRSGRLVRLLPTVFVDPASARDPDVRARAALAYAGAGRR